MKDDNPAQLNLFAPTIINPRGDGSYIVSFGKPQRWVSTRSAAKICGISQDTIARWARDGIIVARRMGPSHYQIDVASLQKFLIPSNHLQ